ncbi:DUF262 domain-containing HNH endonuclease family protein [Akkermansiaceae bacterium]|nr:DUF262 domain-containing HNH endonuclease family protein [Akkermansiaceae bacterium]
MNIDNETLDTKEQVFEISAKSCTLLHNEQNSDYILWKPNNTLQIPVYQRAYSWQEPEVRRLLNDLLTSFFGRNGKMNQEPMFAGTIQLSMPIPHENSYEQTSQDVIDGQQRSTTIILILKALEILCPGLKIWDQLELQKRLITSVSGGEMQKYFSETLRCDADQLGDSELNIYMQRLTFILNEFSADVELINFSDGKEIKYTKVISFINYLCSKVYFVVIETRANLSKTLQIFNSINTSGMDLNGGDIFKVRYYDYIRETVPNSTEQIFGDICKLYEKIDKTNNHHGKELVNMENVLKVIQQIVISEANLPVSTRSLGGATFFERFFDTMLNVNRWDGFNKESCEKVQLTIDKIDSIIVQLFCWHNSNSLTISAESQALSHFIWYSRYGRYYNVQHVFFYAFGPTSYELENFISEFSKLLICFSLIHRRAVNECHRLVDSMMRKMLSSENKLTYSELINNIKEKRLSLYTRLHNVLDTHEIAYIAKAKNLILRIDAMLDEPAYKDNNAKSLLASLFETRLDIEHIESANHQNIEERNKIRAEWGGKLHMLGNLITLEYDINRSISNSLYHTKKQPSYLKSKFATVKALANEHSTWSLKNMEKRHEKLVFKLAEYLCK